MRTNRAVKTGLLVTFIAASGLALAQDEAPPPPQFSTQDEAGPFGAGPQDRGPQAAAQQGTLDNGGWRRRLGPAALHPAPVARGGPERRRAHGASAVVRSGRSGSAVRQGHDDDDVLHGCAGPSMIRRACQM